MFKLALLGFAIFSLTGAISSSRITKEIHDHRDEPLNTINIDNGIVQSVSFSNLLYFEGNSVPYFTYNSIDLTLDINKTLSFDITFKNLTTNVSINTDDFFTSSRSINYDSLNNTEETIDDVKLCFNCYAYDGDGYDVIEVYVEDVFYYTLTSSSMQFENYSVNNIYYVNLPYGLIKNILFTNSAYDNGFTDGQNYVLDNLGDYDLYTQVQYVAYGQQQYNLGVSHANTGFLNLFGAIADTPVIMVRNLFSFDLFGMSALTIFMSLLTGLIVIHFIRKVI